MSWLSRWFGARAAAQGDAQCAPEATASSPDSDEIVALLQKLARVQARQGLRMEEIEAKVEAGFADLRSSLGKAAPDSAPAFDDCFDAMDAIAEAARVAPGAEHAEGLRNVLRRLDGFVGRAGYHRDTSVGRAVDASRFRVVGTETDEAQAAGTIVRIVRAAVLRQGRLVREGEVIVSVRSP